MYAPNDGRFKSRSTVGVLQVVAILCVPLKRTTTTRRRKIKYLYNIITYEPTGNIIAYQYVYTTIIIIIITTTNNLHVRSENRFGGLLICTGVITFEISTTGRFADEHIKITHSLGLY